MTPLMQALLPTVTALMGVFLANYFGVGRDREGDWRKVKLQAYQAYILALSGIIEGRNSEESQARYSDAANSMVLLASHRVLQKLNEFTKANSYRNPQRDEVKVNKLRDDLITEMRNDLGRGRGKAGTIEYFLIDVPPLPGS